MKILVITETVPFPPANGKEIPIANIFELLARKHSVDILVLADKEPCYNPNKLPDSIKKIFSLRVTEVGSIKKIFRSLLFFNGSVSFYDYVVDDIIKTIGDSKYDFVWISPVKFFGFTAFCKKNKINFYGKLVLGLNDSKTFAYRDYINEIICPMIFHWKYFTFWLRSFIIFLEEKAYLKKADLVHVQTESEAKKLERIIPGYRTKTIAAANGIRSELLQCKYAGVDSEYVLFMTHHVGGRYRESEWFLKKVWPKIIDKIPSIKLLIVGKPPEKEIAYLKNAKSVIVYGFADNLQDIFDKVRLAVLPVFHGTGLINRMQDALVAGVPMIATPHAIATFEGIRENEEIISARTSNEFAEKVIWLYNNREKRILIGNAGKQFARSFCTWEATTQKIENILKQNI